MPATKSQLLKRTDAELVEKTFHGVDFQTLPAVLAQTMLELANLANAMQPTDVSLNLDLAAGVLAFRSYRRAQE